MEPRVSIILVNYMGANDTLECVDSLNQMDYQNYHIIVVDNNSKDNSLELLQNNCVNKKFELIALSSNQGFSAGNNAGIRAGLSDGADYILLLNNDTIVEKNFLTELIKNMEQNPIYEMGIGTIFYESQRDSIWYAGGYFDKRFSKVSNIGPGGRKNYKIPSTPTSVTFATGCCMCIKASIIRKVGYLDESYFLYEEDVEYCCRLQNMGMKILYVPSAVIYHKVSASTRTTKIASPLTQYYMARNKFYFIKQYTKRWNKCISYFYAIVRFLYYCMNGEMQIKFLVLGFVDFVYGKKGKSDREFK